MKQPPLYRMRLVLAGSFMLTMIGCSNSKADSVKPASKIPEKLLPTVNYPTDIVIPAPRPMDLEAIAAERSIDKLASVIAESNRVCSEYVGGGGSVSEAYASYERILSIASDDELLALTKHDSAAVRVYAFFGLQRRKSSYYAKAKKALARDNTEVEELSGCFLMTKKVSDFTGDQSN